MMSEDYLERDMALINASREESMALTIENADELRAMWADQQKDANPLAINSRNTRLRLAAEQQAKSCLGRRDRRQRRTRKGA